LGKGFELSLENPSLAAFFIFYFKIIFWEGKELKRFKRSKKSDQILWINLRV